MATFVLVHGAWHGAWCWRKITPLLRAQGHEVFTPTLTEAGEHSHLAHPLIGLETHIRDVVNVLTYEDLSGVILLGHSNGGFGTDANLKWLIWRGYEFCAKGYGGRRASKLAKSVPEDGWREGPTKGQDLGVPAEPHRYARKTKAVVRRWFDEKGKMHKDYLVSTLFGLAAEQIAKLYDGRGGMEAEIKGDKRRLGIEKRRKKSFLGPGSFGALGATGTQPDRVVQEVVPGRDRGGEAGGGAVGEGRICDDGGGEGGKVLLDGSVEVSVPSSVGESRSSGHGGSFSSKWMAYYLAPKLGVNISGILQ